MSNGYKHVILSKADWNSAKPFECFLLLGGKHLYFEEQKDYKIYSGWSMPEPLRSFFFEEGFGREFDVRAAQRYQEGKSKEGRW